MWLNQQTVDAIRIMAELAVTYPERVRALDLPAPTGITFMNVQKTVHALGVAGLVETQRGRAGGIRLARAADTISIGEIVRAFEPTDCPVSFLETSPIESAVSRLLFQAHRGFFAPLETTTLNLLLPVRSPA